MNKILKAIEYAADKHKGQLRKANHRPYFEDHCLRLFGRVALDPNLKGEVPGIIILCHDVVEDCSKSDSDEDREVLYQEISDLFGSVVKRGVKYLTDEFTKARYPDLNRAKRTYNEQMRLRFAPNMIKLLKLYDREINLQDLIADEDYNKTYAKESLDLAMILSNDKNSYQAIKVLTLAAWLHECTHN